MPHYQAVVGAGDDALDLGGDKAGLDLSQLLDAAGLAAVELEAVRVAQRGLVSASAERHVERFDRHFIACGEAVSAVADADGYGGKRVLAAGKLSGLVEQVELRLLHLGYVPLLENEHVVVWRGLEHRAAELFKPLVYDELHASGKDGLFAVLDALHKLVVAVEGNVRNRGPAQLVFNRGLLQLGYVGEVVGAHLFAAAVVARGVNHVVPALKAALAGSGVYAEGAVVQTAGYI